MESIGQIVLVIFFQCMTKIVVCCV